MRVGKEKWGWLACARWQGEVGVTGTDVRREGGWRTCWQGEGRGGWRARSGGGLHMRIGKEKWGVAGTGVGKEGLAGARQSRRLRRRVAS